MANDIDRLLELNDARLASYLSARDGGERALELEQLLTRVVQPRARAVLVRYMLSGWPISAEDVEDIIGHVTVQVIRKLQSALVVEGQALQNVEAYVTALAKNAMRDLMRRRSPERARLNRRLRYLFGRDVRLAVWENDGVSVCGLAAWRHRALDPADPASVHAALSSGRRATIGSADEAVALALRLGRPARLADLTAAVATSEAHEDHRAEEEQVPAHHDAIEARQYLRILWEEIVLLPVNQRTVLLLNLREPSFVNALVLFMLLGVASMDDIAAAVGLPIDALVGVWDDMPLDDLRIGEHLGVTRQQVINMRKAARERLARRMRHRARRQ